MNLLYPPTGRRHTAFTLIELLVVISIIAVLAGLLLPVVSKVQENAKKVSAKATETQIVAAVNNYMAEYGQYPVVAQTTTTATDTTYDGTGGNSASGNDNWVLFNVLRALNTATGDTTGALNSRRIVYFEGKNVKNQTLPKDGFIVTPPTKGSPNGRTGTYVAGAMVDPWGNEYNIRIDTDYSGALANPYGESSVGPAPSWPSNTKSDDQTLAPGDAHTLRTSVIAWSYGTDGVPTSVGTTLSTPFNTVGDDVISWQ